MLQYQVDKMNKSIKKRKLPRRCIVIWGTIFCLVFFILIIPILINEAYKVNTGYMTLWGASDVLSFYAVILSGLITIGVLIATIFYNRKETEKQINLARSQVSVPFFIIEKVYQDNSHNEFDELHDKRIWKKEYEISKYKKTSGKIIIVLKNIGEGVAISPKYQNDLQTQIVGTIPKFVQKNDFLEIDYDLYDILMEKVGPDRIFQNFPQFYIYLTLNYQNTLGVNFEQVITLQHTKKANKNAVELVIDSISHQHVDL